eukprot:5063091-Lingulodinium_polyedra.AAC.1
MHQHPLPDGPLGAREGRAQYLVVHLGGARVLHLVQIYGTSDGARAADANLGLVVAAVAWLRSLGDVPAVVLGDFN